MDYFDEYIKKYDFNILAIKYKYHHSIRVMNDMEMLARCMSLPECDVTLAKCIGLLHDIGRFEQYTKFRSFDDSNLDHGDYGVEILHKENSLSNYKISQDDYEVVYKAIRNHNKLKIEDNLTSRELLFAKMIRDADKLDILYSFGNKKLRKIFKEDNSLISEKVKKCFFKNKVIEKTKDTTLSDEKIMLFAFAYDINFNITNEIIKKQKIYQKIYERLQDKAKYKPYIEHINNYINERND